MASLYVSGLFRIPSATTTKKWIKCVHVELREVGRVLLRRSDAFDMVCSKTRATEENRHELSSGTT